MFIMLVLTVKLRLTKHSKKSKRSKKMRVSDGEEYGLDEEEMARSWKRRKKIKG